MFKKCVFFMFLTAVSAKAFAGDVQCVLQEISEEKTAKQEFTISETTDSHGSLTNYQTQVYGDYSGFVALSNGFIVIHLYNSVTDAAFSVASNGDTNKYARLQYLLPGSGLNQAIIVECAEVK